MSRMLSLFLMAGLLVFFTGCPAETPDADLSTSNGNDTGDTTDPGDDDADPGDDDADPGDDDADPGDDATDPGDDAADPGDDATDPGDDATDPGDDATDPGDDATDPGDDATDPGDDATDPGDDATDPGDDATDPGDDATDPGDDATDPGDDTADPGDDATDPGDDTTDPGDDAAEPGTTGAATEGRAAEAKAVDFSVAWCTDEDPKVAATTAVTDAMAGLAGPTKGLIFYEYYPKTAKDAEGNDKEVPDVDKEKAVLPAVCGAAEDVPVIGCRARSLVAGGTMLTNTVAVLAIGGESVSCKAVKAELVKDRKVVGTSIAEQLADVEDMKLVVALSEMNLSFDTTEGVSVEDFIRGILDVAGKDATLFGGNCMPNDYETDKAGIQFIGEETLAGHVVAMGIGGPIAVHANHTNEFTPSAETVKVTKAEDKWIYEFDGKPATEVYREIHGMADDDEFSNDWQHPIGVIVSEDKVYLRMVLEEDREKKALRFVAAVPEGTEVKILKGGADAKAILEAAKEGITESLEKAGDQEPLLALLSDCCARGMRLREFREADECEIRGAILPAMEAKGVKFPIFGFYAWGELGPIAGEFGGLGCMYQQHTFVSAVITEQK